MTDTAGRARDPFPASPVLREDEVHVVRFALDPATVPDAPGLLDAEEHARLERLRDERHRQQFLAAHAVTRLVLGRCLGIVPGRVRFSVGPRRKPGLDDPRLDLRFNLAHSGGRGILAVALGREVGIDLEAVKPLDAIAIARHFFSPAEQEALDAVPPGDRLAAFHRCWVRKESYLKASGLGLTRALASFDMSLDTRVTTCLLADRDDPSALVRWTTVPLDSGDGWVAALTTEGRGWRLREWSGP